VVAEKYRKIRARTLRLIEKEAPISTGLVAKELKVNWATAQRALYELQSEGKIKGKSVSGRNIWVFLKK
jgi:Mn-dependent DtxR family transcriptional regulator